MKWARLKSKPFSPTWQWSSTSVLTQEETRRLLAQLSGMHGLMAKLLYGSGLRLMECLRLRVKDLEFERRVIVARDGKGKQDRVTILPDSLDEQILNHPCEPRPDVLGAF